MLLTGFVIQTVALFAFALITLAVEPSTNGHANGPWIALAASIVGTALLAGTL